MAESIKSDELLIYKHNTGEYPVLTLAYMGDAVLEMLAREYVLKNSGQVKPGQLVKASKDSSLTYRGRTGSIQARQKRQDSFYSQARRADTVQTCHGL